MTTELDIRAETVIVTSMGEVSTSIAQIKDLLFAGARVMPTDVEVALFLKQCQASGLNPWTKEAHLVKYAAGQPASIILGKDAITKRACREPSFGGFQAGIIVMRQGAAVHEEGSMLYPGDQLIGGWASVSRTDIPAPFTAKVSMTEYASGQSTWNKMPSTMIRKVALVQALREAYPEQIGGLYDAAEMAQAGPVRGDVVGDVGGAGESPSTGHTVPSDGFLASRAMPDGAATGTVASTGEMLPGRIPCPIHEGEEFLAKKGKYGVFFSHPWEGVLNGKASQWCNGTHVAVLGAWRAQLDAISDTLGYDKDKQRELYEATRNEDGKIDALSVYNLVEGLTAQAAASTVDPAAPDGEDDGEDDYSPDDTEGLTDVTATAPF